MPQISNLSFNVSFEPHNPNRVGLINTTPDLPAGFVGIFKVTQPDGYVRNGDINTPDVTNVVSSCVITIVPDSAGQLQQGQYTIEFIGNAPGYLSTSFIRTFTFQYTPATISLRNDFDVFTPQLAYTDISNYNVSGYTISTGPTRRWDATSTTTGTISGTNSSIDIRYNNQYYAETYSIEFRVNVAYVSQAYPWLSITHTRTQTTSVTACIPKSLEDLTQAVEALREESNASCGGDWARFEKANSLYVHLINMLRLVLIAGEHQDGFFDVYQQLLTYIQNGSVACDSIGQVIPPYDFSDYESSIYDGQSSYCQLVGDGVNTVYRVNHQLGDECVVVQVYEVATGKQVFCDLAVSTINSIDITFYEPPTLNQYRVVAVAGALGLRGQGFQPGGLTGQILRKKTNADFDTEWADVTVALPLLVPYSGATQSVYLGEHGIETGYVRFDTTPTTTPAVPAVMSWNDQEGTVDLKLKGNNVTLQIGQEMVARVVNKTGANLLESQYKAVRIRKVSEGGAQGQRLAVVLAQANTEFMSTDMLGIVTENIDNNQEGFITTFGAVKNIDTTGALQGEVWVDGDILFLSPTVPGGLTKVKPSAPNHLSIVGYVEYAHQNNGKIFVHVQTSWELDELHNVSITNPVNNQVLKYNGTLWVNSTFPAVTSVGLATATSGVTITDTPVTSSGVININIATASASSNGLLSSADWATFNAKQSALTFGNISTATSGVTITNGNASTVGPNVSISIATAGSGQNGLLSAADWATFNAKQSAITLTTTGNSGAATFVGSTLNIPNYTLAGLGGVPTTRSLTINGTAYDLSADRTWSVGTVTSVAALTIGTAGTDITSTVATGTTTPVITLNVPTASATNRGALSAADWTTFNAKVGGSGTINYVPKFTAAGSVGNSQIFDNGTNVGIGTSSPVSGSALDIAGSTNVYPRIRSTGTGEAFMFFQNTNSGTTAADGLFVGINSGNDAFFYNAEATPARFFTSGTERLRITSGGNVGVGTTNPIQKFVVSNSGSEGFEFVPGASSNSNQLLSYNRATSAYSDLVTRAATYNIQIGTTNAAYIHANGRIGVNTTTDAGYQFDIAGNLRTTTGANFATTSGNVGIGTDTANFKLDVQNTTGTAQVRIKGGTGANQGAAFYQTFAAGVNTMSAFGDRANIFGGTVDQIASIFTGSNIPLTFDVNAAERMRISSAGVITVANLAGSGARVVVADASGNLSATTLSSSVTTGSGTTNYVTKWTGTNTTGDSQIFDNGTNVGIGITTGMSERFNVSSSTANANASISSSWASGGAFLRFGNATNADGLYLGYNNPTGSLFGGVGGANGGVIMGYGAYPIGFGTNATERLRITSGGDVGIGTSSPTGTANRFVNIYGAASNELHLTNATTGTTSTDGFTILQSGNDVYQYNYESGFLEFGTSNASRLRIFANGRIGINTTTDAGYQLDVSGTIRATSTIRSDGNFYNESANPAYSARLNTVDGQRINMEVIGTDGRIQVTRNSGAQPNLILATEGGEKMRITAAGNVGIGTASPVIRLQVVDAANTYTGHFSGNNQTNGLAFGTQSNNAASIQGYTTNFSGTNDIYLQPLSANVKIGNSANAPAYKLDVEGTLRSVNGANFATTSGNVGIGTASPAEKLQVVGNVLASDVAGAYPRFISTVGAKSWEIGYRSGTTNYEIREDGNTRLVIANGGNVGIGITPSAWSLGKAVEVKSEGNSIWSYDIENMFVTNNAYFNGGWKYGKNGKAATYTQFQGQHFWDIAGTGTAGNAITFTTAMAISNSGNVGIGTASPVYTLHLNSSFTTYAHFTNSNSGTTNADGMSIGVDGNDYYVWVRENQPLYFGTNSTSRQIIHANGRVGINTTTDAGYQLDINGTLRSVNGANFATTSGNVGIGTASPTERVSILSPSATSAAISFRGNNLSTAEELFLGQGTAGAYFLFGRGNYDMLFGTNNSTRMVITSGGNVGIGTASPSAKLTVVGAGAQTILNSGSAADARVEFHYNSGREGFISWDTDNLRLQADAGNYLTFYTNATEAMRITSSGNVGIGTASPSIKLDIGTTADQTLGIKSSTSNYLFAGTYQNYAIFSVNRNPSNGVFTDVNKATADIAIGGLANEGLIIFNTTATNNSTATERMRLTSSGELLINTTTDAGDYKLQVNGNLLTNLIYTRNNTDALVFGTNGAVNPYVQGTSGNALALGTSNNPRIWIASDGNVGIGTTSPVSRLQVQGAQQDAAQTITRFAANNASSQIKALDLQINAGSNLAVFNTAYAGSAMGIDFADAGTSRMRIFSNGRVAINTTTDAGYQLDVNGGTRVTGKITVTANDALGLSIARAGTSAIASEIYNGGGDNGWLLYGVESSAGGVIFPGTTAYASVFGSFRSVPVQFATNNAVRMTIDGGGSVGIGVASPSASAILQVDSTTKGMLPPRMTTTQRDAITSPATGLIVYDTTVNKISVYNGTTWKYAQYE